MKHFFCEVLNWCGSSSHEVERAVPEINAQALLSAIVLIAGLCVVFWGTQK